MVTDNLTNDKTREREWRGTSNERQQTQLIFVLNLSAPREVLVDK